MRKIYFILCLIIFFVPRTGSAQNTDSLIDVLKTAKEDTNKVKLLNVIAAGLKYSDPLKAIDYAKNILRPRVLQDNLYTINYA